MSYIEPSTSVANIFEDQLEVAVDEAVQVGDGGRSGVQQPRHHAASVVVVQQHACQPDHQESHPPTWTDDISLGHVT